MTITKTRFIFFALLLVNVELLCLDCEAQKRGLLYRCHICTYVRDTSTLRTWEIRDLSTQGITIAFASGKIPTQAFMI